jgi:DNA-binding transcriptional MerR regulator
MDIALPAIPAKRYFTIGEVSELCGVKAYVLRYWEQEFTQLRPMKRRGNRRYYQHHEVLLIRRIRELLYDQGFTISGARNRLAEATATGRGAAFAAARKAAGLPDRSPQEAQAAHSHPDDGSQAAVDEHGQGLADGTEVAQGGQVNQGGQAAQGAQGTQGAVARPPFASAPFTSDDAGLILSELRAIRELLSD